jgi:hypothetical protein
MNDVDVVTKYFEIELVALGYPTDKVYWSLSYCQGDGMAFYGKTAELTKLAQRLLDTPQEKAAVTRAMNKGALLLNIEGANGRYHHYASMGVYLERDTLTDFESLAVDALLVNIKEDVRSVSKRLAAEGYKILESFRPAQWTGKDGDKDGSVTLEVVELAPGLTATTYLDDEDCPSCYESGEPEDHAEVKELAARKYGYCSVRVVITDEAGARVGWATCGCVSDDKELVHVKEIAAECLDEAKHEAKKNLEKHAELYAALTW